MRYILTKLSYPGWEKEFSSEVEARYELYKHICFLCRKGENEFFFEPVDDTIVSRLGLNSLCCQNTPPRITNFHVMLDSPL